MKRTLITLVFIFVVVSSVLTINPISASTTPTLTVDSATQQFPSAKVGDTILVNVTISNVNNLWAWDIEDLTFNQAILKIENITEGSFLKTSGQQTIFTTSVDDSYGAMQGYVRDTNAAILATTGVSGNGVIATLEFQVLSLGTSQILFNQTTLLDPTQALSESMPSNAINANVVVGASSSNPTTSPSDNTSPTPTGTSTDSTPTTNSPTNAPDSSTSTQSSPTAIATTNSLDAPEFPTLLATILIIIVASVLAVLMMIVKREKK